MEPDLRLWGSAIGFLFVSIFDIAGVQFGIGMRAGLIGNDGLVPRGDQGYIFDWKGGGYLRVYLSWGIYQNFKDFLETFQYC